MSESSSQEQAANGCLPSPEKFFLESSLYRKYPVSHEQIRDIINLRYFHETIDSYCIQCKQNSIFHTNEKKSIEYSEELLKYENHYVNGEPHPKLLYDNYLSDVYFFVQLYCGRDIRHKMFFCFRIFDGIIEKVGQYPSLADLQRQEIGKYRKILGDSKYNEFSRAVGLHAHGVGIGSFVYLRRIFEYLVDKAYEKACKSPNWSEKEGNFQNKTMDEKIASLRDYLPEILVQNKSMYSILSKGVHELSEDECQQYFGTIKIGLELILDEEIQRIERDQKTKNLTNELSRIKGKMS